MPSLLVLLAAAADTPASRESLRQAVGLFGILIGGLAIGFLILVALVLAARRRRLMERKTRTPAPPVRDAWSEAGRRAEPYE